MPMRIAQLAPLVESVPPEGYGGTELVVHLLTEELIKRGHEVTLFASADSNTSARLIPGCSEYLRKMEGNNRHRWAAYDIRLLLKLKDMQDQFDVIHNHSGWQALPFAGCFNIPMVTTNHNPIGDYSQDIYLSYGQLPYVSISDAYRQYNFGDKLNYVETVYNGIDTALYNRPRLKSLDYLVFLGRLSKAKGTADAVKIARSVGMPLKVAGKVDVSDQQYYENEVLPELHSGVEFIGEVGPEQKAELLSGAYAVIYPIAFEEPFGLVMAESLAAGVPVVALDRGSVREVLSDGETAIIGNSVEELIHRFGQVANLTEQACRARARKLFSKEQMACSYEQVFERVQSNCKQARFMSTPIRG